MPLVRSLTALLLTLVVLTTHGASAGPEVVGLFKDRAVIRIGPSNRVLKVGEVSPEGVRLISANAREAVVEHQGERLTLTLSSRVSSSYAQADRQRVSIASDQLGQYRIRGAINGHYVNFLVDTGASVVALSTATADAMGLDYSRGQKGEVVTAQGTAESWFMILDEVKVAGITGYNVQAAVISGQYPVDILLGMSFLRQVTMSESSGVMTLMQKF